MNQWGDMEPHQESYTICMLIKTSGMELSNGKYKLSLNVSISCIDISGLLGDISKILHMNTLAYCIMSRYCSIVSIFAKTSLRS